MELWDTLDERPLVPRKKQVEFLIKMGFDLPQEVIDYAEKYEEPIKIPDSFDGTSDYEMDKFMEYVGILSALGHGKHDFINDWWTKSSNQVFSFEYEVYSTYNMYEIFFEGLKAISSKDIKISNVTQNNETANYENGEGGHMVVNFEINSHEYEYSAFFTGDWLDTKIINYLNEVLENENTDKRFYLSGSDYSFLLFCTEEFAKEMEKELLVKIRKETMF